MGFNITVINWLLSHHFRKGYLTPTSITVKVPNDLSYNAHMSLNTELAKAGQLLVIVVFGKEVT